MKIARSLWASVQGDPVFMRRVNGWLTIFWVGMSGHWSAWQAARVEVAQAAQIADHEANPIEEKVVEAIVEKTDVKPS